LASPGVIVRTQLHTRWIVPCRAIPSDRIRCAALRRDTLRMRLRFENFGQKIVEPLMPGGAETAVPP
jgi:hypothetical protein